MVRVMDRSVLGLWSRMGYSFPPFPFLSANSDDLYHSAQFSDPPSPALRRLDSNDLNLQASPCTATNPLGRLSCACFHLLASGPQVASLALRHTPPTYRPLTFSWEVVPLGIGDLVATLHHRGCITKSLPSEGMTPVAIGCTTVPTCLAGEILVRGIVITPW